LEPGGHTGSKFEEMFGFVPRFARLQGPIASILERQSSMLAALLNNEEHLARAQKERILLAVSAAGRNAYGVSLHEQMLKLQGASAAEIEHIIDGRFAGTDAPMVAFARQIVLEPEHITADDVEELRRAGLNEPQIVEVAVLAALGVLFNTIHAGTGATPDFAVRSLPAVTEKILHREVQDPRPTDESMEREKPEALDDPDREWVLKVQEGDINAFEILVQRHSQKVFGTMMGLLSDKEEARDALQDTFLKAFRSLRRFERRSKFGTWLLSIAINTGTQRLRDRKYTESLDVDDSESESFRPRQVRAWQDDPEEEFSKAQRRSLLEQSIARLPAKYRVVVVLRDMQQLSTEEAAAALGLGVPALKARLFRGRLMLREALAPHFTRGAQTA